MNHSLVRRRRGHRPHLETLEDRLPPGDALLGALVGMAWLPGCNPLAGETGGATAAHWIHASDDWNGLDAPSRPAETMPTSVRHRPTDPSTDRVDGIDTLEAASPARLVGITATT